jgi:hypothetical protein
VTVKYLLPCSCGEKIAIESSQAGQAIRCSCGKTLEAPTMQGIRRLEQSADIVDESAVSSSIGGVTVGIALLGLIILSVGGGIAGWNYTRRPVMIDVDYMSPWDTWLMWQSLREGVRMQEYSDSPYLQAKKEHTQYMTVGFVIIGVGIVTLVGALAIALVNGRSKRRKIP